MGPDVTAELEDKALSSSIEPALARLGLQSRILEEVDTAVIAVDLAGTIIFANKHATTLYGWETSELVGTTAADLMILAISREVEDEIAAAISQGGSWEGTFEVRRKDGSSISVRAVDSPLYDAAGELIGIVSAGTDATRERASELLMFQTARDAQVSQFLADCSTALATFTDYEDAIGQLGRSCVPFLADVCLIDVGEGERVRRMVAAHHLPEQQHLIDELEHYGPDPNGDHPAVRALRSGSDALSDSMSDAFLRATTRDDHHYAIVKELNFESYICVPLVARGRILGALTLVSCDAERRYGEWDLELAREVAWRAALLLDNARLLSESSHVARVLQASLMPPSLPVIPGLEAAARYVAFGAGAEVGGDFYDLFSVGRGAWVFALGDVCGRGPEAAVVTGSIRHALRSAALDVRHPGRLLGIANEVLLRDHSDPQLFSTLLCGILRPQSTTVRLALANAGHPPPILVRADGSVEVPHNGDTVVGVFENVEYSSRLLNLHPGDIFVAYTDGITEARRDGELFEEHRVAEVVREARDYPIEEIADRIIAAVRDFAGHEPNDDLALIALRVLGGERVAPGRR
jgi:PAS domain S-box-containing protein